MSEAPSMPFWIDAYLADTGHLTTEEHGAYILLLMAMWRRGGVVPDDDRDNARLVGLSQAKWRVVKERLRPMLTFMENGISQKRLGKEWDFCAKKRQKLRENGCKGGRPPLKENNDLAKANGFPQKTKWETTHTHTHKGMPIEDHPTVHSVPDGTDRSGPDFCANGNGSSWKSRLFTHSLAQLQKLTGKSQSQCRSLLGRWLKQASDDAKRVGRAIEDAAEVGPVDPVPWITAAIRGRKEPTIEEMMWARH